MTSMSKLKKKVAESSSNSIPRSNVLRYSVVRQILWGKMGDKSFGPYEAPSGGGQTGVDNKGVNFNKWNPHKKKTGSGENERGGVIVPGWWIILPENLGKGVQSSYVNRGAAPTGNSLRVVPYKLEADHMGSTRGSFYIHGTGGKGSDGCILLNPTARHALVEMVCEGGGAWLQAYFSPKELDDALTSSNRANTVA